MFVRECEFSPVDVIQQGWDARQVSRRPAALGAGDFYLELLSGADPVGHLGALEAWNV